MVLNMIIMLHVTVLLSTISNAYLMNIILEFIFLLNSIHTIIYLEIENLSLGII